MANGPSWELRRVRFEVPRATEHSESAALPPLARREVFAAALQRATALAESPDASLLLVTKSHGNASLALTTLFSVLRGHASAEAFFAHLDCDVSAGLNIKG